MTDATGNRPPLFRPLVALCVVYLALGLPLPAYAYVDPGSGSMLLQLLFGGVAGLMVLLRISWQRLSDRVRFRSRDQRTSQ